MDEILAILLSIHVLCGIISFVFSFRYMEKIIINNTKMNRIFCAVMSIGGIMSLIAFLIFYWVEESKYNVRR